MPRKPRNFTPYARKLCEEMGWVGDLTERWAGGYKIDYLGMFDFLALNTAGSAMGIQITSNENVPARVKKMKANPNLAKWLENGGEAEVWGFGKKNNRILLLRRVRLEEEK